MSTANPGPILGTVMEVREGSLFRGNQERTCNADNLLAGGVRVAAQHRKPRLPYRMSLHIV